MNMAKKNDSPVQLQEKRLVKIAGQINQHRRQSLERIALIGALLEEAKEICGHGNWGTWLKDNFGWSDKTAQNYMRVNSLGKSVKLSDLEGIPASAIYLLPNAVLDGASSESVKKAAGKRTRGPGKGKGKGKGGDGRDDIPTKEEFFAYFDDIPALQLGGWLIEYITKELPNLPIELAKRAGWVKSPKDQAEPDASQAASVAKLKADLLHADKKLLEAEARIAELEAKLAAKPTAAEPVAAPATAPARVNASLLASSFVSMDNYEQRAFFDLLCAHNNHPKKTPADDRLQAAEWRMRWMQALFWSLPTDMRIRAYKHIIVPALPPEVRDEAGKEANVRAIAKDRDAEPAELPSPKAAATGKEPPVSGSVGGTFPPRAQTGSLLKTSGSKKPNGSSREAGFGD
jgi:Protein of unknown function (DUF3102)